YEPPTDKLPPELRHILERCLAKDKDQRYPDAGKIVSDLKDLRRLSGLDTSLFHISSDLNDPQTARNLSDKHSREIKADTGRAAAPFTSAYKAAVIAALALIILSLAILGFYVFQIKSAVSVTVEQPAINSLAVLPFENANADTEYLSDGIAESLINSLSNLQNLRVV